MGFKKTLRFTYSNLPKDFYLVFTFDDQSIKGHTMFDNLYPIAWKIAHLQAGGDFEFRETYEQQFAFATVELQAGIVKTSAAVREIEFKQQSTVTGNPERGYNWSKPVEVKTIVGDQFAAKNETGSVLRIAICSRPKGNFVEPLLYMEAPDGGTILAHFIPRLRCYAVHDMKQGAVIEAQVSSEVLFDQLLNQPELSDDWKITYDAQTDSLVISPS